MNDSDQGWLDALCGRFIVFDGPDGSGKTTQFHRFSRYCQAAGVGVCEVREPGGTLIGEHIREVLLNPEHDMMALRCEMMLYMASRAQLVAERIRPALAEGKLVLADRFISSTLAYQGTAGGMSVDDIRAVGHVALGENWPDLVVVFDVDDATAAQRLNPLLDRMELKGTEYHARVRQGYLDQAAEVPKHYAIVDARPGEDEVFDSLCTTLAKRMADLN